MRVFLLYNEREPCNDFSIGIELEGTDTLPYTDAQYLPGGGHATVNRLVATDC